MVDLDATTPQLKALKNYLDAYRTLDINNVGKCISKDYKFQTHPKIDALPDEGTAEHFKTYGPLLSLLTKLDLVYHEIIEAPGKVVVNLTATCHTVSGEELEYDSLAIFTIVEEDGELKVSSYKDFSNPEKRSNFHGWIAKAVAQRVT